VKRKKVLVLGATGMAGHICYTYLEENSDYELYSLVFRDKLNEDSLVCNVRNSALFTGLLTEIKPDIIINCIGVLIKGAAENAENAVYLNAYLPHQLEKTAREINAKLIHISTDCVFSGNKGSYKEDDFKDAKDIYGLSKNLGEIINKTDLTVRTSIIGPELKKNGEGLMHWFFSQRSEVNGFTNAIWSGVTTLSLAKGIHSAIEQELSGLYHLTNNEPISKYKLLNEIKAVWIMNLNINKVSGKTVNKSILDTRNEIHYKVPSYTGMLQEMKDFMTSHSYYYKYYNLM
jgi:dTDP-4-dehydrorhamnose reductase